MEKRPLVESTVLLLLIVVTALFMPAVKGIFVIIPIIYFFVEAKLRNRGNAGMKGKTLLQDIKQSWLPILLVSVVFQCGYILIFNTLLPEVAEHVKDRVPLLQDFNIGLVLSLLVLALGEEITFRGLFQNRFTWVMKPAYAIILTSLAFTLAPRYSGFFRNKWAGYCRISSLAEILIV
ncbi:CPBP family intramembrane glutamic endopeptidase [Neobacillus muris]|uniref:CPBP family intramembrane glutamic endopeptidase n=1 Tax=Neobacillus muris TaxID=2941334 RepID=UPI002041C586|nr:CPBP family intramembrane glutamic endopeptidase [Neobacillus muris]